MISLENLKRVHLIGIKGTGMSTLALALAKLGIKVSGSDAKDSFLLIAENNFTDADITIASDFDEKNIVAQLDAVIVSTSHTSKNVEINKAKKMNIPILTYPEIVGMLTKEFRTVAVCGSHGKTTTTNLLAHVLQTAGLPVIVIAGPTSQQVLDAMKSQGNGVLSKASRSATGAREQIAPPAGGDNRFAKTPLPWLILEADEYQNKLAHYSPFGVILTNIELDHPDYFKSVQEYEKVFEDFLKKIPWDGFLIDGRKIPYELGEHFVFNAQLVTLAAKKLGVNDKDIKRGISTFRGSPRRLEKISEKPLIFDDYGHHPTEIKTTLRALRNTYTEKRIIAVFHPHTYSRTKAFLKEFGASFADADEVVVLDIFESREVGKQTISSKDVVEEIKKNNKPAYYCPTFDDTARFLKGKLGDDTLLLTIGAGDVWKLHTML